MDDKDADKTDPRRAFILTEYKPESLRKETLPPFPPPPENKVVRRDILYADSEKERDEWVLAIQTQMDYLRFDISTKRPSVPELSLSRAGTINKVNTRERNSKEFKNSRD
jgi:hypothetical protein